MASPPKVVLYGPTTENGAKRRAKLKRFIWYVEWYEDNGTRREQSLRVPLGGDYTEAFARFARDRVAVPEASELITDVLRRYWDEHGSYTISSGAMDSGIARLEEFFVGKTLEDLDEPLCQKYVKTRPSLGTARTELIYLATAINHGADRKKNSRVKVWKPEPPPGRDRLMTRSEYARLLWYWRRNLTYRTVLRILMCTGARLNSVIQLGFKSSARGGHIDLERNTISLNPHGRSRTKKEKPVIPIPRHLIPALKMAHARNNDHLCIGRYGKPISMWAFEQAWRKACSHLGIEGTSPHVVKHTTVTNLVDSKHDVALISRLTGTTPGTLLRKYTHLRPESVEHLTRRRRTTA